MKANLIFIMKNKSLMLISLILLFCLAFNFASADVRVLTTNIRVTLNGQEISDTFYIAFLGCLGKNEHRVENIIPQLNISEYDPANNCYWKPVLWKRCKNPYCETYVSIMGGVLRLAVYVPSQDKLYLSEKPESYLAVTSLEAELLTNGSLIIKKHEYTEGKGNTIVYEDSENIKFFAALAITLILELVVALIYVSITGISKKVLISVLIANIISFPVLLFAFPTLKIPSPVLSGEIFAFAFEGCFIYLLNKEISLKKSFIISILMNMVSLIIGGLIFMMIFYI